mmetsp:Transcript_25767/g.60189  ORF Transcript_25767/g.60189 Transcript_25767/m.60189 type:complete len:213 (-) Transcript_25767:645-1283(-)
MTSKASSAELPTASATTAEKATSTIRRLRASWKVSTLVAASAACRTTECLSVNALPSSASISARLLRSMSFDTFSPAKVSPMTPITAARTSGEGRLAKGTRLPGAGDSRAWLMTGTISMTALPCIDSKRMACRTARRTSEFLSTRRSQTQGIRAAAASCLPLVVRACAAKEAKPSPAASLTRQSSSPSVRIKAAAHSSSPGRASCPKAWAAA